MHGESYLPIFNNNVYTYLYQVKFNLVLSDSFLIFKEATL